VETYCRYHPPDHAGWHCSRCHSHFCDTCVPDKGVASATCPVCHSFLSYTGQASEVTPFWQCLSDFFAYPFATAPLFLIAICTLFPALAGDGLVGLIVAVFLMCAQTKYMYTVVENTAMGELNPPALGTAFTGGGLMLVIQQVFILLAIVGVVFLTSVWLGEGWALLVMGMLFLVLPASVMILATEHEVSQALDISRLIGFIQALGWPYFVMYGYILLLLLGMGAAQSFVMEHLRPGFALTITGFITSYFFLVIFSMMGYVLYQYQHRLGGALVNDYSGNLAEKSALTEKHTLVEIDIALKEGNYDLAITSLTGLFNHKPHDKLTLNRLFRLLLETQHWEHLDKRSRPMLALLLETGRIKEIRQMLRGLYKQRPQFEVRDPELAWHLAQSLYHAGEYRLLLRILKDFGSRFKNAEQEPEVLALSARALANGLHNCPKAKVYLQYLKKQFPLHPLAGKVPEQLEQLEKSGRLAEPKVTFS
jgi:hypothetical protein